MSSDKSGIQDRSGSDRPDGYYWVRIGTEWRISEWVVIRGIRSFWFGGVEFETETPCTFWNPTFGAKEFSEIHGPIRPPDYDKALEEWGPEHTQHISDND